VYNDYDIINQGDVLGIGESHVDPKTQPQPWAERIIVKGVAPIDAYLGKFVIALEPIPFHTIGRAAISGIATTRVHMDNEAHEYADVSGGTANHLHSRISGAARILWKQPVADRPATDSHLAECIVSLNSTGSVGDGHVPARVVDADWWLLDTTPVTAQANRWSYTCIEQEKTATGWQTKPGGRTFYACQNGMEERNGPTGVQGNGVNVDNLPPGFCLVPIRGNPVVALYPGFDTYDPPSDWRFYVPNSVDGVCDDWVGPQPQSLAPTDRAYMMAQGYSDSYMGVT
jgi:hypothetical protein